MQGRESVNFFSIPAGGKKAQDRREDIYVHLIVENVPMKDPHKIAILRALGDLTNAHCMTIDSKEWTACPRNRYWFATFEKPQRREDTLFFPRRPVPWEKDWSPHIDGRVPTSLRSRRRAGDSIRVSTYQGHIAYCCFQNNHPVNRWPLMTLTEARHHVGRLLGRPEYLRDYPLARAGLRWITAGTH